jgi:pyruvate-formate lyase
MNERVKRLRHLSFETAPSFSAERAVLVTEFYRENAGRYSVPVLRALNFKNLCAKKTIYIGEDELVVGERGPAPKAVSTFPELTCHSVEDLEVLNTRSMQRYLVDPKDVELYRNVVIPYWQGRSMRDRAFAEIPQGWKDLYEAGLFTEFMEQRAPGHTSLDGTIYRKGMLDFKKEIAEARAALDFLNDPEATEKDEELKAMDISCDAAILFAERHAALAEEMAASEKNPRRREELLQIAQVCRRVPASAPRTFWEALQMYWFVHLGTITELNGWDAMSPGTPGSAPRSFLRGGGRRGNARPGPCQGAALLFLDQGEQHPRASQGGRHRRRERHLQRFHEHQFGRTAPRRFRRIQ